MLYVATTGSDENPGTHGETVCHAWKGRNVKSVKG